MLPRNYYTILIAVAVCFACHLKASRLRLSEPLNDAVFLIDQFYVEPVRRQQLVRDAMEGMLEHLDPFSEYIDTDDFEEFHAALQQQFAGIGVIVEGPPEHDRLRVAMTLLGSPAALSGLRGGDLLIAIDGQSTVGLTIDRATDVLRGPIGSTVRLTVERTGAAELLEFAIERASIHLESVVGDHRDEQQQWVYRLRESPDLAYIRVATFGEQTVRELNEAIDTLQTPYRGLILDLRRNAGGLLDSAIEICDMLLEDGPVVQTQGRQPEWREEFTANAGARIDRNVPIVVLIDEGSASASEIVAACLQDRGRAKIAGMRSFGKGTVQNVLALEGGRAALKLTTARYLRPSGANIQRAPGADESAEWGVRPEASLTVKLTDEQSQQVLKRWQQAMYAAESIDSLATDPQLQAVVDYFDEGSPPEGLSN
jgi:carboxyl-terminal processing protease